MTDKIMINVISKIYLAIVSFFVFTSLLLFVLFITLQNGIFIEDISTKQIQVKQLYIKWNEKLDISLKEIRVKSDTNKEEEQSFNSKELGHLINSLLHTKKWFHSIVIEQIFFNDLKGSFKYENMNDGFFIASSDDIDLNASISSQSEIIKLKINNFTSKEYDIVVRGDIYLHTKEMKVYTNLDLDIVNEASLTLYTMLSTKDLKYRLKSNKKIKSIKKLIQLAHLPNGVNYWAYDAITKMSYVELQDIYGLVSFDDIKSAYKDIYIKAIVHNADYKYNPTLDAIHTKKIELEFTQGHLNIRPIKAYSYGMFLDKSWLYIDFTKKEELLTLFLNFNAKLNKDVLGILKAYKIELPFLQRSGVTKTDLILKVGLREISVGVQGEFYTKKANFDYIGLNIDIADAKILLNNYDVKINNMKASYKQIADAKVDVVYDAKESRGKIDFKFTKVVLKDLNLQKKPLYAQYYISPKGDSISIKKSKWKYKNQLIGVDKISIPFDINNANIVLPATLIEIKEMAKAFVSGEINLKNLHSHLDVDLLEFSYRGIKSTQSNIPFKVNYTDRMILTSKNPIYFDFNGSKCQIKRLHLDIDDATLAMKHTIFEVGDYLTSKIYMQYNFQTKKAHISVSDFLLRVPKQKSILYENKRILLTAALDDDTFRVSSSELDAKFILKKSGWKLKLNSLHTFWENSTLLKQLHIDDGDFLLYQHNKSDYIGFKASLHYPYKIFIQDKLPMKKYTLNGKIYNSQSVVEVNNHIDVVLKDNIKIHCKNTVINLKEIIRAMSDIKFPQSKGKKPLNIMITATNSQLYYSQERSILYDTLDLQYYDNVLSAQLQYKDGRAGLEFLNKKFHLYGEGFNDTFMNHLFSITNFKKGALDFSIGGSLDDYKGTLFIRKTIMKDYKTLNNILAFINTVPSLVTFNVPGYSKKGIFVKNAYVNFEAKNNIFHFSDIFLDSKEIDILGRGTADLNEDKLDLMLNLKTDLGSELSKVPLVGYVILGKDTISTTLSIKGDMNNPQIQSLLAKDIIVAPLNIIKRTLLLPYHLLNPKKKR